MATTKLTLEQRFWSKVDKSGDCWLWTKPCNNHGYGRLRTSRSRRVFAHRFSYELTYGLIPDGLCVLHRCDNPPCVNPDHLFLGTMKDNTQDMIRKGRSRFVNPWVGYVRPSCSICVKPARALGFCLKHYERFRVHGDPRVSLVRRTND